MPSSPTGGRVHRNEADHRPAAELGDCALEMLVHLLPVQGSQAPARFRLSRPRTVGGSPVQILNRGREAFGIVDESVIVVVEDLKQPRSNSPAALFKTIRHLQCPQVCLLDEV